jgi:hypothetical protein
MYEDQMQDDESGALFDGRRSECGVQGSCETTARRVRAMKFRPQIQLRFRDEGQYVLVKDLAAKDGLSLNEWILRKVENGGNQRQGGTVSNVVSSGRVLRGTRKSGKRRDSGSVGQTPAAGASTDRGTDFGGVQKDRGKQKSETMSREKYNNLSKSDQLRAMREGTAPRGF